MPSYTERAVAALHESEKYALMDREGNQQAYLLRAVVWALLAIATAVDGLDPR